MKVEPTPSQFATTEAKPLVWILNQSDELDEWLTSHPPSRLNVPAAFNNGITPQPLWVLGVNSIEDLAELAPDATIDKTFVKAGDLARHAACKVLSIQNDDNIPTHRSGKAGARNKKQCRTEVQDDFRDRIMLMAAEHPLWNQGRWTMIIRPQQIDNTFAQLAKSLASGELRKHSSIIALRARPLPFEESSYEKQWKHSKRKKSGLSAQRSSLTSPTSARHANEAPLGIDIFFRPVWNSSAARDVLKLVAGVSGQMATFCKASLYSRLGIRSGHQLASHSSLYNCKALASPADAKLWTQKQSLDDTEMDECSASQEIGLSGKTEEEISSDALSFLPNKPPSVNANTRKLEGEASTDLEEDIEERARKSIRSGEGPSVEHRLSISALTEPSGANYEDQLETQESQDEPVLPTRPVVLFHTGSFGIRAPLAAVPKELPQVNLVDTQETKLEDAAKTTEHPALLKKYEAKSMHDESQTQVEPSAFTSEFTCTVESTIAMAEQVSEEASLAKKLPEEARAEEEDDPETRRQANISSSKAAEESKPASSAVDDVWNTPDTEANHDLCAEADGKMDEALQASIHVQVVLDSDSSPTAGEERYRTEMVNLPQTDAESEVAPELRPCADALTTLEEDAKEKEASHATAEVKSETESWCDLSREQRPTESEETKRTAGSDAPHSEEHGQEQESVAGEAPSRTDMSAIHTAHTVETVKVVRSDPHPALSVETFEVNMPAAEYRAEGPPASSVNGEAASKPELLSALNLPDSYTRDVSLKLKGIGAECNKDPVEQITGGSTIPTTNLNPRESGTSGYVIAKSLESRDANLDAQKAFPDEGKASSAATSVDKHKPQASAANATKDSLTDVFKGSNVPLAVGSQLTAEESNR